MISDDQLETLYKSAVGESHYAGLRAVWDSGYNTSATTAITSTDASAVETATVNLTQDPVTTT